MIIVYVLIIGLTSVFYIYYIRRHVYENFQSNQLPTIIQMNNLEYGCFDQIDNDLIKSHQITSFPLPLPLQNIKQPAKNLSQETIKELDFLIEVSSKITNKQKQSIDRYEKDVFNEFVDYCKN